jgi:2-dehydropantoate 2-reductase
MNVLIYGAGAVGLGIASALLKAEVKLSILARPDTVRTLKNFGLVRNGIFGPFKAKPDSFQSFSQISKVVFSRPFDHILICTKSFDSLASAMDLHKHKFLFHSDTSIILFQNGWGNAEIFSRYFSKGSLYNARVITGFIRQKPNSVKITVHADAIHIGSLFSQNIHPIEQLCNKISKGGIPCIPFLEIEKDLWAKMLYNCALNPTGAIFGVSYGKLSESKHSKWIMDEIIKEVYKVMGKSGYSTHIHTDKEYIKVFYDKLIPLTAEHESSTLQDLRAGKQTEIDALNGAVIQLGLQNKVYTPFNQMVYHIIKYLEQKKSLKTT